MADKNMDAIFDGIGSVSTAAYQLRELAAAFDRTGNLQCASELRALADDLTTASMQIRDGYVADINRQVAVAEAGTRNMINAALAGTVLRG